MFARIRDARENESGFTLVELLIVIVILGVLSGIVVFSVAGITNHGDVAACKASVKTVEAAQEAFYAQATPPAYAGSVDALVKAKLIKTAPTDITTDTTGVVTPTCKVS